MQLPRARKEQVFHSQDLDAFSTGKEYYGGVRMWMTRIKEAR